MPSIEDRLSAVESELSRLRQQFDQGTNWIVRISGSMKDYPEFEEVIRLGREARQNDFSRQQDDKNGS